MPDKLYMGIDPGLSGGVAFLGSDGVLLKVMAMPVMPSGGGKNEIDIATLKDVINALPVAVSLASIEKVNAMPKQGVTSMFTFGRVFGELIGMLKAMGIPYGMPTPVAWKKAILTGTAKDKDAAVAHVYRHYPVSLMRTPKCRTSHHGMAEAVCLAEHARMVGSASAVATPF